MKNNAKKVIREVISAQNPMTQHCTGCIYLTTFGDGGKFKYCGYLEITGKRRGCEGDENCNKKKIGKKSDLKKIITVPGHMPAYFDKETTEDKT